MRDERERSWQEVAQVKVKCRKATTEGVLGQGH